ncbi:MAG: NAD(P)/FAD-dependent oxidoreductase [Solirubrobacterales bacterium]|nr:NAD(P)/FAD-dependent oxidoreductase [Solirubrobacterales bacterium]
MRILVLGAGFGGLELTTTLAEEFGGELEITVIDRTDSFVFGFSKLDVMFGRVTEEHVKHSYADFVHPGVSFVQAEITKINGTAKRVETSAGEFEADILVVGLGADLDCSVTPGLAAGVNEFYTEQGAFALRDRIAGFEGGKVVIGVISAPFKCPPAPSETALLMHDHLTGAGLRDQSSIALVMPFGRPIPPSPDASAALIEAFGERDIDWHAQTAIVSVDDELGVATTDDGTEIPYDLFLGVPHHRAPDVVLESDVSSEGWIPVDPLTLETPIDGVYAIGDVAAVGTPKAGVFAEGQGKAAAVSIAARIRGDKSDASYDGHGVCYIEFGEEQIGMVDVTFFGDEKSAALVGPDVAYIAGKAEFGTSRIKRWFGNDWTAT